MVDENNVHHQYPKNFSLLYHEKSFEMNQYHQQILIYHHKHVQLHEHKDEQDLLLFLHIHQ